ncbi:MAG: hypothetical protein JEY94_00130 [Melioribacteraceae bacterium]|nr:hypothetical protein [Melioribacteraceae bacterium]
MRNSFLILWLLLFSAQICSAQILPGARQIALSNSDIALSNDVFALFTNPAGTAQIKWREFGVYYSPSPFGMKELANGNAAYTEPFNFGSVSVGYKNYGFDLYKENTISLGFAAEISENLFGGITLNYHNISIKNYGSAGAFIFDTGIIYKPIENIRFGLSISNLNYASVSDSENQIPTVFRSGITYSLFNKCFLNLAVEKEIEFPISIRGGLEYPIIEFLSIRTGFKNEPASYSVGIGINYLYFKLDYSFFTHQDLGLTHQAGIIISFKS